MNIFRLLLVVAIPAYVISGILMVKGMVKFKAESATATGEAFKKLRNAMVDPFLVNVGTSAYVIWHIQPLVVHPHHGPWFILNAFIAWCVTTLSWYLGIYSTRLFVPLKLLTLVFLYGSCVNTAFARVGVSALAIALGVYFFWTHRELWTIAIVAIGIGAFGLLRALGVENAATIIWAVLKIGGVCFFTLCFFESKKKGKVVCAIIVAILLAMLLADVRILHNMFVMH